MPFNLKRRLVNSPALILVGLSILSVGTYLLVSLIYYRTGFPLDDAWIHQTYARNLALSGEWAFLPGQVSGGSTAPLWSVLLVIPAWLHQSPYVWTYTLGVLGLCALAILSESAVRKLVITYRPKYPWVGIAIVLEWHLVWAAGSGMETLLFALLVTVVLTWLATGVHKPLGLGLLVGLSIWVRPDGITLLGPVVLAILFGERTWSNRLRAITNLGVGFGILFGLYLLFNLIVVGSPWPNTFYAKQAEYFVLQQIPLWKRFGMEALQPLIGVGIVLLPGFFYKLFLAIRGRSWGILVTIMWLFGYLGLFAWLLPVTYQHGRYVMPVMPFYFAFGFAGLCEFAGLTLSRWRQSVLIFWKAITGLMLLVFWGLGAWSYARDVAVIESEMVTTARWVSTNLPPEAVIAAHDIGALGYFGDHTLVDLAGLISPEVIPYIRDENKLGEYLDQRGVDYLVTFPDWYPSLTSNLVPLYSTDAPYALSFSELNMVVYRW